MKSNIEADKQLRQDPNAEKFAIATHRKSGKSRIIAWNQGKWIPVGPEHDSEEDSASKLKMVTIMAEMNGKTVFSIFNEVDQQFKKNGIQLSDIPDEKWVEIVESKEREDKKMSQFGLSNMMPITAEPKLNQYLKDHPGSEKIATVTHKPSGKTRWLAWIGEKWVPIGPEFPDRDKAISTLKKTADDTVKSGLTSLIGVIQKVTEMTMKEMGVTKVPSILSDEQWVALIKSNTESNQIPSELFSEQPQHVPINRIQFN